MKRMLLLFVVAALTAAIMAPVALAEQSAPDPGCTFEKGRTTCTKIELASTTFETVALQQRQERCGFLNTGT